MDFNYKKQDDEDFYKIIGCDQLSNVKLFSNSFIML